MKEKATILAPILDEYSNAMKFLTSTTRLINVINSMTALVRVKFYYNQEGQKYINLSKNMYDELKYILGV